MFKLLWDIKKCVQQQNKSDRKPTIDQKVIGLNPGWAIIWLHVFHKQHIGHKYCLNDTQEAII